MSLVQQSFLNEWIASCVSSYTEDELWSGKVVYQVLEHAVPKLVVSAQEKHGNDIADYGYWKFTVGIMKLFFNQPFSSFDALGDVDMEIAQRKNTTIYHDIMELVLCLTVECAESKFYIHNMMTMDSTVQTGLMEIIQRTSAAIRDSKSSLDHDTTSAGVAGLDSPCGMEDPLIGEEHKSNTDVSSSSIPNGSNNVSTKRLIREHEALKEELQQFSVQYQALENENRKLSIQTAELTQQLSEQQVSSGLHQLSQQQNMEKTFETQLSEKNQQLEQFRQAAEHHAEQISELSALKDQVDVLQHIEKKNRKNEMLITKYQARLEEASGLRNQTKSLQQMNADLVQKNLHLETQMSSFQSLRKKLEDFKVTVTSTTIEKSELQQKIQDNAYEIEKLRHLLQCSKEECSEQAAVLSELQLNRETSSSRISELPDELNHHIASGVSELNPEFSKKVTRLEYENAQLKIQVASTTTEQMESLQDQLDEQSRLAKSYEKKYLDMSHQWKQEHAQVLEHKDALENQRKEIKTLEQDRTDLQVEVQTLEGQVEEEMASHQKDSMALLNQLEEYQLHMHQSCQELENQHAMDKEIWRMKNEESIQRYTSKFQEFIQLQELDQAQHVTHESTIEGLEEELDQMNEKLDAQVLVQETLQRQFDQATEVFQSKKTKYEAAYEEGLLAFEQMKNQASKRELEVEKMAKIVHQKDQLVAQSHLRIRQLEKENRHLSTQVKSADASSSSLAGRDVQLENQFDQVTKELMALQEKYSELQNQQQPQVSPFPNSQGSTVIDGDNLLEYTKQIEQLKTREQEKRRELILCNANLLREQKQTQMENQNIAEKNKKLQDQVNSLLLKEMRYKKYLSQQQQQPSSVEEADPSEEENNNSSSSLKRSVEEPTNTKQPSLTKFQRRKPLGSVGMTPASDTTSVTTGERPGECPQQ